MKSEDLAWGPPSGVSLKDSLARLGGSDTKWSTFPIWAAREARLAALSHTVTTSVHRCPVSPRLISWRRVLGLWCRDLSPRDCTRCQQTRPNPKTCLPWRCRGGGSNAFPANVLPGGVQRTGICHNLITHHAQAKMGVNWGVISWNNYAASKLNIVQFNALETWAGALCCFPRRSARRLSHAAPNGTGLAPSQSGAPPTFGASVAAAATAASASAAAAVLQRRWCQDCLAAVLLRTPPPFRPCGEATRLPLQPVWRRVVREGWQGSPRSLIDLFHTAPKLVAMIATRSKRVPHGHEASRLFENGCYLYVFTPPKGRDLGVIGRDRAWHAHTPRVWGREIQA